MGWLSVRAVTAMDIFKIQSIDVVQSAVDLASLKWKQGKILVFQPEIPNWQGFLLLV
jgi:hypothetical protein